MEKLAAVDCGEGNQRTGEEGCEGSLHFILYTSVFIWFLSSLINININATCQGRSHGFHPWKIHWRRKWPPTPVFLPGKSHGERSLVGCSPWGRERVGHNLVTKQQQQHIKHNSTHGYNICIVSVTYWALALFVE